MELNLSDYKNIERFAQEFKSVFGKFDVLVNNAGIIHGSFKTNKHGIEEIVGCIFIGHLYLTSLLVDCFNVEARLVNVTSHTFEMYQPDFSLFENDLDFVYAKNNYNALRQYTISKTGISCFTKYMTEYLKTHVKHPTKVVMIHPGWVHTSAQLNIGKWWVEVCYFLVYPLLSFTFKNAKDGAQSHIQAINLDFDKVKDNAYFYDLVQRDIPKFIDSNYIYRYLNYAKRLIHAKVEDVPAPVEKLLKNIKI